MCGKSFQIWYVYPIFRIQKHLSCFKLNHHTSISVRDGTIKHTLGDTTEMTIIHSRCCGDKTWRHYEVETRVNPRCDLNRNGDPCLPCGELAHIEAQIEELHSRLNDLHANHRALCLKRNASHKCLVTKLPYEIASDILIRVCLPGSVWCKDGLDPEIIPMTLATVCHRWRELVFSIPKLWSSFTINAHEPDYSYINRHLRLSGPRSPLFIRLMATYFLPSSKSLGPMQLVKENLHRIAYLCITFSRKYLDAFAFVWAICPDDAPLLEEFHFHGPGYASIEKLPDLKLCTSPSRPRKVVISRYPLNQVRLDWTYISHMTYEDSLTFDELCDFLSMAKSLVEFKSAPALPSSQLGMMIIHNSIRKLNITGNCGLQAASASTQAILTYTTMPSLESLTTPCCDESFIELSAFIQRSACQLTSLDLSCYSLPSITLLIKALEDTPTLQELGLSIGYVNGDQLLRPFLKYLGNWSQYNSSDTKRLPHLQKFTYSGTPDVPLGFFLEVMESRRNNMLPSSPYQIQALQELVIRTRSPWLQSESHTKKTCIVAEDDLPRILELRLAGKMISVSLSEHGNSEPVDLVEQAMKFFRFGKN